MRGWCPDTTSIRSYWLRLCFCLFSSNHMKDPVAPCRARVYVWVKSGSEHEQLVQGQRLRGISAQSCRPSQAKLIFSLSHYRIFCLSAAQLAQSGQRNTDAQTHQALWSCLLSTLRTSHIQTSKNQLKVFASDSVSGNLLDLYPRWTLDVLQWTFNNKSGFTFSEKNKTMKYIKYNIYLCTI